MSEPRIILFHPTARSGLGHVSRLSAIALALRQIDPSVQTPFAIQGDGRLLLEALSLHCVPLPSGPAARMTKTWVLQMSDERSPVLAEASLEILASVHPQIVVFDCYPNPEFAEAVVASKIPIVLCLRQMRDLAKYLHHAQSFLPQVNLILIPHQENAFELPEELKTKSCFVGQIARPIEHLREPKRRLDQPHIVITGGGGGSATNLEFYNLAMRAISELRKEYPNLEARLIAGPFFRQWPQLEPTEGVSAVPFEPDTLSVFGAADLVISRAGYNTVSELEQLGTKAILVPVETPGDDQFARADRVESLYPYFRRFRGSDHIALARLASELLRDTIPAAGRPQFEGAGKAACLLYSMLERITLSENSGLESAGAQHFVRRCFESRREDE